MPTYTKSSAPGPDSMRLNYLEEKVRNLAPGEAPDLAALTAKVNRIFRLAFEGAADLPLDPDDPDQTLFFEDGSAIDSLFKSVWGNIDRETFAVAGARPLHHQVLVGGELSAYFAQPGYSLAKSIFPMWKPDYITAITDHSGGSGEVSTAGSLVQTIFGANTSDFEGNMIPGLSLLDRIVQLESDLAEEKSARELEVAILQEQIDNLWDR